MQEHRLLPGFLLLLALSFAPLLMAASAAFEKGLEAFQAGDYATALSFFQEEEARGNTRTTLYYNLGSTHYQLGNYQQAADYFARITQDERWGALAEYNLGLLAEAQNNTALAIRQYRLAQDKASGSRVTRLAQQRLEVLTGESQTAAASEPAPGFIYLAASLGYDDNLSLTADNSTTEKTTGSFSELLASGRYYLQGDASQGLSLQGYVFLRSPHVSSEERETGASLGAYLHQPLSGWQTSTGLQLGTYLLDSSSYTRDLTLDISVRRPLGENTLKLANDFSLTSGGTGYGYLDGWQNRFKLALDFVDAWEAGYRNEWNSREDYASDPAFYSYSPLRHSFYGQKSWQASNRLQLFTRLEARLSQYPDKEVDANGIEVSEKRQDWRWLGRLRAGYQLTPEVQVFSEFQALYNTSNLDSYDYTSHQLLLGVDAVF
ncbi:tetratricopeptide repeat protein [Marinospirillum perlucidum]|uniref:tetratricopeptide repeat protein n=1 Tax=Marinospirillum perlucidum TaxID=1982602 RepID=UPI000DF2D1B0|nr:outer membrane beta-barrel protein [Marinospirillum perlucidum]